MGLIKLIQSAFSFTINTILTFLVLVNVWLNINKVEGVLLTIREVLFWLVPTMTIISIWTAEEEKSIKK
jgi:uncharacterized membrane protein (GlpM family)